jgi:hypothetical protein
VFFIWLFVGSQTGLELFQPVEAGKLAFVFLSATVLMLFDGRIRARPLSQTVATTAISFVSLALLAAVVAGVPGLRSDWSPIVIMSGLTAGLLFVFGVLIWARAIQEAGDRHVARQSLPQVFKPGFRKWWYVRNTSWIVVPVLAAIALGIWAWVGAPLGSSIALVTGSGAWPGEPTERLLRLESPGLGTGRRLVVERFLTWTDLGYDRPLLRDCEYTAEPAPAPSAQKQPARTRPPPELAIRSCYRDIELQVIRSRRGIALGPCGFSKRLDDGAGGFARTVETVGAVLGGIVSLVTNLFVADQPNCGAPAPPLPSGGNPEKDRLDLRPIRIPVVEKDFAPAYLIGVFGTGAGFLFYAAQAMLVGVVIFAFVRISRTRSRGALADEAVRRFVAIVLAGAALLFVLQWSLSWSNVLGLLPVMGQPMTWLAYATSHHLFLALPCILVFVVGLRYAGMDQYRFTPREVPRRERGRWASW